MDIHKKSANIGTRFLSTLRVFSKVDAVAQYDGHSFFGPASIRPCPQKLCNGHCARSRLCFGTCKPGVTLSLMGHFNKAITHYQACLKIDPNDINSINAMGNALQFKGEYDTAIESYSKAIALAPTCAEAHNNLGNASENQGNLQAAVKSYTQALVYQPENEATQNI